MMNEIEPGLGLLSQIRSSSNTVTYNSLTPQDIVDFAGRLSTNSSGINLRGNLTFHGTGNSSSIVDEWKKTYLDTGMQFQNPAHTDWLTPPVEHGFFEIENGKYVYKLTCYDFELQDVNININVESSTTVEITTKGHIHYPVTLNDDADIHSLSYRIENETLYVEFLKY